MSGQRSFHYNSVFSYPGCFIPILFYLVLRLSCTTSVCCASKYIFTNYVVLCRLLRIYYIQCFVSKLSRTTSSFCVPVLPCTNYVVFVSRLPCATALSQVVWYRLCCFCMQLVLCYCFKLGCLVLLFLRQIVQFFCFYARLSSSSVFKLGCLVLLF